MSSFFTVSASQRKRKRQDSSSAPASKRRGGGDHGSSSRRHLESSTKTRQPPARTADIDADSISASDSAEDSNAGSPAELTASDSEEDGRDETAAERRLKLAERYLDKIRAEVEEGQEIGFDAKDVDRDLIASRLQQDVDEEQGKIYNHIAEQLDYNRADKTFFRADTLATTGVATCPPYIYTVSKDSVLIKWRICAPLHHEKPLATAGKRTIPPRRRPKQLKYVNCARRNKSKTESQELHTGAILCVAASTSGKFIATGGEDRKLIIWDAASLAPLKVFTQHRDAITSLAFRGKTHQLFSGSKDRTIKIWSLDELVYVETLFGHLDEIVDIAAVGGAQERLISVGARDRSARLWKVAEESQLVFRGGGFSSMGGSSNTNNNVEELKQKTSITRMQGDHDSLLNGNAATSEPPRFPENSLDRVIQPSVNFFITGSDSGALSLYALHKKKAMHVIPLAHGYDPPPPLSEWSAEKEPSEKKKAAILKHGPQPTPRWITALACIPGSDIFVSGSWDGHVRVWRISSDQRRIEAVGVLGASSSSSLAVQQLSATSTGNGTTAASTMGNFKGVINDIAVFQRGERGKDGISIIVAVASEPRLGRWILKKKMKEPGVKNGAFVIDVPHRSAASSTTVLVNGTSTSSTSPHSVHNNGVNGFHSTQDEE